jgi:hypothetical protein
MTPMLINPHLFDATAFNTPLTITNPDASSGTTGWTGEYGNISTRTSDPAPHITNPYFYNGPSTGGAASYQELDLIAQGISAAAIDTGLVSLEFIAWCCGWDSGDRSQIGLRFKDSGKVEISSAISPMATSSKVWFEVTLDELIPVDTRYVDLRMVGTRYLGGNCDAYFDDLTARVYK